MAKVLLVEDDNNLREIYEARLAAEGYDISSAQDGEEALVVAKQAKPDLVISDVMMPKISGFEMLDILRNTAGLEHVKVIMLTALGQSEDRDRADSLGADKYLVKSQVTLEDIVKTAHELLDDEPAAPAAAAEAPSAPAEVAPTETIPVAAAPEPVAPAPGATDDTTAPAMTSDTPLPTPSIPTVDDATATEPTATIPEPVANAPTTDAGMPATATIQDDTAAATDDTTQAGSMAQEENLIDSQIDSFVNNVPAEASEPQNTDNTPSPDTTAEQSASDVVAPAPTTEPTTNVTPTAEETAATTADDQIMANAVNELAGGAEPSEEPEAVVTSEPVTEDETAPEDTSTAETPEEQTPAEAKADAEKTNISISGKKTIQPLDSEPKPDINELLAREEAASGDGDAAIGPMVISNPADEAAADTEPAETPAIIHQPGQSFAPQPPSETTEPAVPTPEEDQPSGGPAPSEKPGIDPNSIAL